LSAQLDCTILVVHHARKRIGDNPTEAGQMVRGSGDLVATIDTLLYLRAKEAGAFVLEQGASRRALPHEPILVRIESTDEGGAIRLVNEGPVAMAEDKVEAMLAKVLRALAEDGGTLERQVLALRAGTSTTDRTFQRALRLGLDREQVATNAERGVGEKAVYALAEGGAP
jgi:hypothetical protein